MEKQELNRLFEAIKVDDVKSFSSVMLSKSDLNICFGRFPILSLLYLYNSYKILEKFERYLLPIHNYNIVEENYDAYLKFKMYAKKSLKLFVFNDKIIYPIEMLAILDERYLLTKFYKKLYKNEEIVQNLHKIYILNNKIDIDISLENIDLPKKKFSFIQKIITGMIFGVFALVMAVSSVSVIFIQNRSGIGTSAAPIKVSTESQLQEAIKKGKKYYSLQNDITLTTNFTAYNFNGTLYGNGYEIVASEYLSNGFIKILSGTIDSLAITTKITDKNISQNYAIIAEKSSGNISNCEIFAEIDWQTYNDTNIYLAGMVAENNGTILGSSIEIFGSINNNRSSNVFFAGVAGINNGTIENCETITARIDADTVDIGGVVAVNNNLIKNCENNINLVQISAKEWNPNTAGICITNYGKIQACKNYAEVSAESTLATKPEEGEFAVLVGGIVADNYGEIFEARNLGKVVAKSDITLCYAGGIVARNILTEDTTARIERCKSQNDTSESVIYAFSKNNLICVGGVAGHNSSEIINCGFIGTIDATNDFETTGFSAYVGGVVGYNNACKLESCYAKVEFNGISDIPTLGANHLYGFVAGCVGVVQYTPAIASAYGIAYVSDNHYVVTSSKGGIAYGIIATVNPFPEYNSSTGRYEYKILSQSPVEITDATLFVSHEKLEDISSEVLLND